MRSFRHFFPRWSYVLPKTRLIMSVGHPSGGDAAHAPDLHASPAWRALYVAALFETDEERMMQRIAEAKKALVVRARELFQSAGDHVQEQSAIEDTLQSLHALEHCRVHLYMQDVLSAGP